MSDHAPPLAAGEASPEALSYLERRRSVPVKSLRGPGPSPEELRRILTCAARVPDHGRLAPWYFLVFEGEHREKAGDILARAYAKEHPDAPPARLEMESGRLMRAPVVVFAVSRIRPSKIPVWEQFLSAGASCYNLCLAASASGFGANWVTEWYSYSPYVRNAFGLDERDNVAGAVYIGTPENIPEERARPEPDGLVTFWKPGVRPSKGDSAHDQTEKGFPLNGFFLPEHEKPS